jgi:hypothetical protein
MKTSFNSRKISGSMKFNEELELATSLNFEAKNSCIYADLRKVSRKALFEFMSVAYRNFIKGAKWKAFRDFFYEELKHRYDTKT